jgi:hypothetical protein
MMRQCNETNVMHVLFNLLRIKGLYIFRALLYYYYDYYYLTAIAGPIARAIQGVGLRPLAYCDRGFKSHREHGCLLCVLCVVCCQVEVSATS